MAGKIKDAGPPSNPTEQSGRPVGPTYKYPLTKGLGQLKPKLAPDGTPAPLTNYGQMGSGPPSSVSVTDSNAMADIDIAPKYGDPVRDHLASSGFGDHGAAVSSPVEDLTRKIDTTGYPPAFGMESSVKRKPGVIGHVGGFETVPDKLADDEAPLPKNYSGS